MPVAVALCKDLPVAYIKARREDLLLTKRFLSEPEGDDIDDVDADEWTDDDTNELPVVIDSEGLQTDANTDINNILS